MQTILVAENNEVASYLFRFLFERAGLEVQMVANGKEAWEYMEKEGADLIVTDHYMPEMTGLELCERIHEDIRFSHVPVVLVSSYVDQIRSSQLKQQYHIAAIHPKPFNPLDLVEDVKGLLAQRNVTL